MYIASENRLCRFVLDSFKKRRFKSFYVKFCISLLNIKYKTKVVNIVLKY